MKYQTSTKIIIRRRREEVADEENNLTICYDEEGDRIVGNK